MLGLVYSFSLVRIFENIVARGLTFNMFNIRISLNILIKMLASIKRIKRSTLDFSMFSSYKETVL